MAMQNKLAGMKPNCAVRTPIMQIRTLLIAATTHPVQSLRPTMMVDRIVNRQEM